LNAIAITDHDTLSGIAEAQQAALGSPVLIPGIEISAEADGEAIDILGYYVQPENPALQTAIARFSVDRLARAQQIVERLNDLGMGVTWERVLAIAGEGVVGRVHIAHALLEAGHVEDVRSAFDRYLGEGCPAYVLRERPSPEAAIALIHGAGGAAVLAHPGLLRNYRTLVERLVPAGLDGVEVLHPANGQTVRANLRGLARAYNLVITGGSDFHYRTDALGAYSPPPECLRDLRGRASHWRMT